jgi:Mor family transcriptional regulator
MTETTHHIEIDDLPDDARQIAEVIGLPALLALSARMGGDSIHIPHLSRLATAARDRAIRAAFNGRNYRELGIAHGITARWVRAIVAGERGPESDSDQQSLYKQQKLF